MDKTLNLVAERLGKLWKVILNVLLTQTWVYIWVFHLVASAVCFLSLLLSSSYCFVFFPPQRVCQSSGAYLSPVDAKSDVKLRYWNRRVWNMKQCYITSSRSEHLCRRKRPTHLRTLSPNTRGEKRQRPAVTGARRCESQDGMASLSSHKMSSAKQKQVCGEQLYSLHGHLCSWTDFTVTAVSALISFQEFIRQL